MAETETQPPREPIPAPARKLMAVGGVLAALMVPTLLINGLVREREGRQRSVSDAIAQSWGPDQMVTAPVLVVPWQAPPVQPGAPVREGELVLPPEELRADAVLAPEERRRGLFSATVYTARLQFAGQFQLQRLRVAQVPEAELRWQDAHLMVGSNGMRMGGVAPRLRWGEAAPDAEETFVMGGACGRRTALRWNAGLDGPPEPGRRIAFDLRMALRGSEALHVLPLAGRSHVTMQAAWPTPSFVGGDLPERSEVTPDGFSAEWRGGAGQVLPVQGSVNCQLDTAQAVGVELLQAVPTYRMVNRASKYALFFLALAFMTCGCFEMLARVRVHVVQYALLGASVVMFPLLLLALGEAVGFAAAYVLTAAAVVLQSGAFVGSVTRRRGLGLAMGGVLSGLFGFLYVVLSLEALSLLVGTMALFAVLSVVMALTRRVEWGR
ncbi:cell envelope integrity protein CreD [Rhodovarius crocodyli]|uniref:Cell envelope integrity protein CreD n=1 Tax=Rhodovarius crocodyli TaxID=1979269 RepID=A0A437MCH4_9PROT|nr:cell envelope integrity protein CreD [Rhodovarius crocodyli]RVT95346.1 cell envelope integrity protein CreD [Rhodovarius crocodyli]